MNEPTGSLAHSTRRRVLQNLVGAGGLIAADLLPGRGARASRTSTSHLWPLDLAATTQTLALTFYHAALTATEFHLGEEAVRQVRLMLSGLQRDAQVLWSLGGTPLRQDCLLPEAIQNDARVFVMTGLHLEQTSVSLLLFSTRDLAAPDHSAVEHRSDLTVLVARLATSAAQRRIQLAHLAGLEGAEADLGTLPTTSTEALTALDIYIGRIHPGYMRVESPTVQQIKQILSPDA